MKCRRAFDVDLTAVVRGEGDAAFLAHVPTCPDCAAEVRVWEELDGMLRAGGAPDGASSPHPEPETLVAFVDAPTTLAAGARGEVERHLAACRICTDEVGSLRRFDPGQIAALPREDAARPSEDAAPPLTVAVSPHRVAPSPPVVAASSPAPPPQAAAAPSHAGAGPWRGHSATESPPASSGSWIGRLVWHPGFAYALVAVLLVPLLRDQLGRIPQTVRAVDARRAVPVPVPVPAPPVAKPAAPMEADVPARAPAAVPPPPAAAARAAALDAARAAALDEKKTAPAQAGSADVAATRDDTHAEVGRLARQPEAAPAADPEMRFRREAAPELADRMAKARSADTDAVAAKGGAAAAPGAPPAPAEAAPIVVEVRSSSAATIPAAIGERGVLLRIIPPENLAPGPLDVHVRSRAGGHQLATHVTDRANAIAVRIPPRWLVPGDYTVTLSAVEKATDAEAIATTTLGFTVRAPTSAEAGR